MPSWLIGALVALAIGLAATLYLWSVRRRDDETTAGLLALAAMRWRDFSRLVLSSLQLRGLERLSFEPEDIRNQNTSFLLGDAEGKHWLLSCKHGTAYRIGSVAIDELASEARLRGAHRAILATEGLVDSTGRDKAERSNVEVLDGSRLWQQVKPMLDNATAQRIVGQANQLARRRIGLSWILALLAGVLVTTLVPAGKDAPPEQPSVAAAPAVAQPAAPDAQAMPPASLAPATEQALAQQRSQITRALAKTGGLRQPAWISDSTLSVDMLASEQIVMAAVCAELAKHPDLSLSRIQLNPAPGSDAPIRWRQCKAAPLTMPGSNTP